MATPFLERLLHPTLCLLIGGCFWVGRGDVGAWPVDAGQLQRPASPEAPTQGLPAGWAAPRLSSVAPDPLALELDRRGAVRAMELGDLALPAALAGAFQQSAGGAGAGAPVSVLVERLNVVCVPDGLDQLAPGVHLTLGAMVRYADGPWAPLEVTLDAGPAAGCAPYDALYTRAGRVLAAKVAAAASPTPPPVTPLPALSAPSGTLEVCLANDARPAVERRQLRPPETWGMILPIGLSNNKVRGVRTARSPFTSSVAAPSSPDAERVSAEVAKALGSRFPGARAVPTPCEPEAPTRADQPRVWLRLDHAWTQQYLKSNTTVTASRSQAGNVVTTTISTWIRAGGTPPLAYWRAELVYCEPRGCRAATVAGQTEAEAETTGAEEALAVPFEDAYRGALTALASSAAAQVATWTTPPPPAASRRRPR